MRWRCHPWGAIIACAGLFIILAIILPTAFWWIFLGAVLIMAGCILMRR